MVLKDLALVHWNRDMFEEALRAMEEAVDIYKRTKDKNQLELANTLNSLAALYWNQVVADFFSHIAIVTSLDGVCTNPLNMVRDEGFSLFPLATPSSQC